MTRDLAEHPHQDSDSIDLLKSLPVGLLQAELRRREDASNKPDCGTTGKQEQYNTGAHVFALFLILTLSSFACSIPVIARRFPNLPIPHRFLFLSRHFGTGVLIATAFIHLLPTAFVSLTDPCLPAFWNESYPPMAGAIAMLAVFVVVTLEMIFATKGAGHVHDSEWARVPDEQTRASKSRGVALLPHQLQEISDLRLHPLGSSAETPTNSPDRPRSLLPPSPEYAFDESDELDHSDYGNDESAHLNNQFTHEQTEESWQGSGHRQSLEDNPQKLLLQCLLLEAGILFHSVFIGMAVSVATGTSFVVLLIAICFHQTFEGFALGSRIAMLIPDLFEASSPKPWLMALAYGATTPAGQALGIWMHRLYDPNSEVGLLMVGVTNSISSGLLLFAGLVQLIAEDFLSDRSYEVLKGRRRIEASLAVALGGLLMAIVGAFA